MVRSMGMGMRDRQIMKKEKRGPIRVSKNEIRPSVIEGQYNDTLTLRLLSSSTGDYAFDQ